MKRACVPGRARAIGRAESTRGVAEIPGVHFVRSGRSPVYDALVARFRGTGVCLAALSVLAGGGAVQAQDLNGADRQRAGAFELQLFLPTPTAGTTFTIDRPT